MNLNTYFNALKFRFNRYPSHLIFFVTARCNLECRHCFYWQAIKNSKKEKELTLNEIKKISENFKHIKFLSITGGEPSLRDDLPEIVHAFYKNNGIDNLAFHTNGFLSEKIKDIAIRIVRENPDLDLNLSVSLEALNEGHDSLRGVQGAFERAKETIEITTKERQNFKNLNVTVNTCFTYYNQDKIKEMVNYFFNNFDISGYYISLVRGNAKERRAKEIDINKYKDIIAYLDQKRIIRGYYDNYPLASLRRTLDFVCPEVVIQTIQKKRMIYPCTVGRSLIIIAENGNVLPCEMLNEKFGNLRDNNYDIKKILSSDKLKKFKSFIRNNECYCSWECAIMNSLVFNWRAYPRLLYKWLKLELKKYF